MRRFSTILFTLFVAVSAFAQNTFTVDAPNVVTADENFRIVFTADGRMSDFNWVGSDQFTIVWGPQSGSMSSTSIVNGKRTSTHQETRTYIVQANGVGRFTLPAATATIGKKDYSSGEFVIEVVSSEQNGSQGGTQQQAPQQSQQQAQQQQSQQQSAATGTVSNKDIFLSLSVNKSSVVKGEPLIATLKLYTRADIQAFEDVHFPTFNGFWSKEVEAPQNIEFVRENVNGTIYNAALLRKYMLIPQQNGKIVIDPAEMVCLVRVMSSNSQASSFFDSFFDSYQTIRKRLSTSAVTVNVRALPSGAPASFGGGVGSFKMEVTPGAGQLKTHEAGSLVVKISGRGNISMLEAPHINFPPDFEVYDIKTTEDISADGTSGSKTFEFPFIPRSYGDFNVEAINYSYYDISKGSYATLSSGPLKFSVEKGEEIAGAGVTVSGVARQGVKNLADDIRFIHSGKASLRGKDEFFAGSVLFWILLAALVVLFFGASYALNFLDARRSDVAGTRNRRATKMAKMRLRQAGEYLKNNLNTAYFEELHKAVLGYVADKLMIPSADLSKERIVEAYAEKGVSGGAVDRLVALLNECEEARYAPEAAIAHKDELYSQAIDIISDLDSMIKTNRTSKKGVVAAIVLAAMLALPAFAASAQENTAETASTADPVEKYWSDAAAAYTAGDYASALENYKNIESFSLCSDELYYNIGNCHYKMGDNSRAILYYEKCLKINPSHKDALNNVTLARQFTLDKIEVVPDFILVQWLEDIMFSCSADAWAWIALGFGLLVVILLLGFKFLPALGARKASFVFACIFFALTLGAVSFSLCEKADAMHYDEAIMIQPVSSVKSSPGDAGKSIFVLHEGTKVEVLDNLGDWTLIQISDGRQGWAESSSMELI